MKKLFVFILLISCLQACKKSDERPVATVDFSIKSDHKITSYYIVTMKGVKITNNSPNNIFNSTGGISYTASGSFTGNKDDFDSIYIPYTGQVYTTFIIQGVSHDSYPNQNNSKEVMTFFTVR